MLASSPFVSRLRRGPRALVEHVVEHTFHVGDFDGNLFTVRVIGRVTEISAITGRRSRSVRHSVLVGNQSSESSLFGSK
jgi:hypothetical protein